MLWSRYRLSPDIHVVKTLQNTRTGRTKLAPLIGRYSKLVVNHKLALIKNTCISKTKILLYKATKRTGIYIFYLFWSNIFLVHPRPESGSSGSPKKILHKDDKGNCPNMVETIIGVLLQYKPKSHFNLWSYEKCLWEDIPVDCY